MLLLRLNLCLAQLHLLDSLLSLRQILSQGVNALAQLRIVILLVPILLLHLLLLLDHLLRLCLVLVQLGLEIAKLVLQLECEILLSLELLAENLLGCVATDAYPCICIAFVGSVRSGSAGG